MPPHAVPIDSHSHSDSKTWDWTSSAATPAPMEGLRTLYAAYDNPQPIAHQLVHQLQVTGYSRNQSTVVERKP